MGRKRKRPFYGLKVFRHILDALREEGTHSQFFSAIEREAWDDRQYDMMCDYFDYLDAQGKMDHAMSHHPDAGIKYDMKNFTKEEILYLEQLDQKRKEDMLKEHEYPRSCL